MKKLILVRSGTTSWDEENRIQGTVPLPLSESGKEELRAQAAEIVKQSPEALYSSGNESAGPTASYLADICDLKAKRIPCFHELDCGLWQGLRMDEIQRRFKRLYKLWLEQPTSVCPPQGETVQQATERIREGLAVLRKKCRGKTVVLVAAPLIAALIECELTRKSPDEMWKIAHKSLSNSTFLAIPGSHSMQQLIAPTVAGASPNAVTQAQEPQTVSSKCKIKA